MTDPFTELTERWNEEAEILRRCACSAQAELTDRHIQELEELKMQWQLELLTLRDAARESGFSYSTLQHMLAEGRLENAGSKNKPRVRRRDLPRKGARRRFEVHRGIGT
jgi:hypothetical protein